MNKKRLMAAGLAVIMTASMVTGVAVLTARKNQKLMRKDLYTI